MFKWIFFTNIIVRLFETNVMKLVNDNVLILANAIVVKLATSGNYAYYTFTCYGNRTNFRNGKMGLLFKRKEKSFTLLSMINFE